MTTAPIHGFVDTWNDAGITFSAIKVSITDTASAADSKLIDFEVGGVSQASIGKDGGIICKGLTSSLNIDLQGNRLVMDADNDTYLEASTDDRLDFVVGGTLVARFDANAVDTFQLDGVGFSPTGAVVGQALGYPNSPTTLEPYTPAGGGDALLAANETVTGNWNFTGALQWSGVQVVSLSATQELTNKTLTSPTISGGSISGITDLAIADGGTGASTPSLARQGLGAVGVAATYAALTAIVASDRYDTMRVYVQGRAAESDGGEGVWRFDAGSSATANGGTVLAPDAGTGRWLRDYGDRILLRWFCDGDSSDATTELTAALAVGDPISGEGLTYGVSGNLTLPADTSIWDANFIQLTPASTSRRTLTTSSVNNIDLRRVNVNRNGAGSGGSISDAAGIWIAGGSGHTLQDVEVYGDDMGTGIFLTGCSKSSLTRCIARDIRFLLSSDPGDDRINGIWLNDCTDMEMFDCHARDLSGSIDSGSTYARRYTRGLVGSGLTNFAWTDCSADNVDQGFDFTGSTGNIRGRIVNGLAEDCNSYSFKVANSGNRINFTNCISKNAGLVHYIVSGNAGAGIPRVEYVSFSNCLATGMDSTSSFSGSTSRAYFFVDDLADTAKDPRFVNFYNCVGEAGGGTGPQFGYRNNCQPIAANGANLFKGGRLDGATSAQFSDYAGPLAAQSYLAANQSLANDTETAVDFDTDDRDPYGMRTSSGVFTAYEPGLYAVEATVLLDNNATGVRRIVLRKNSTNLRVQDSESGDAVLTGQALNLSTVLSLDAGDTISLRAYQNRGSALNIVASGTQIAITYLGVNG